MITPIEERYYLKQEEQLLLRRAQRASVNIVARGMPAREADLAALRRHELEVEAARKRATEMAQEQDRLIRQEQQANMDRRRFLENTPHWIPPRFGPGPIR